MTGFDNGEALAAEIQHPDRTVPFVVVSTDSGKVVLPELDPKLAYDLAGLANVVVVDEDASWAITDILGPDFSCYRDWFGDPSAWRMSEELETIGLPEPGDLVLYRRRGSKSDRPWLYHVMMSLGGGTVVGACGIKLHVARYDSELYSQRWSRLDSPYRRFPAFTSTSPTATDP